MDFRVLGPLEVRVGGRAVTVAAGKGRIALAGLLLRANRVVSVEQLASWLWGTSPQPRARSAVQVHVARLRKILGGDDVLQTAAGGYVMSVDPDTLDLLRFRRLAEDGRQALAADAPEQAEALLGEALALWRGPALSEVDSEELHQDEIAALNAHRVAVDEQWLDVRLRLGQHESVVANLQRLTREHPLRERGWELLMTALYRCDRQADALAAYREVRDHLGTELGIDPGTALRDLHTAILAGDATWRTTAREPLRAPCQLPLVTGDFVGRAEASAAVTADLLSGVASQVVPVVTVSGTAGIGKTALAVRVAHQLRVEFPDGQLYARLDGTSTVPRDPAAVLAEFLDTLGVAPDGIPAGLTARAAAFRALTADRRVLVVLDDAADADQVEPLLPGTAGTATLVTSRRTLADVSGARNHRLAPLSSAEGLTLLRRMLGDGRLQGQAGAATEIVELCGGLPLALRILGARLQPQPAARLDALAGRLRDEPRRLDELVLGRLEVRAGLEISYTALPADLRVAFRRMGLLPTGDFAAWTLGALTDGGDGDRLVEQLVTAGLVDPIGTDGTGEPRYRPHDLVAVFARERAAADDEPTVRASVGRLLDALITIGRTVYARVATATDGLTPEPLAGSPSAPAIDIGECPHAWVHAERALVLDAIRRGCEIGLYVQAATAADLLVPAMEQSGLDQLRRVRATIRDAALAAGDEVVAWRAEYAHADLLLHENLGEAARAFARCVDGFRRLGRPHELVRSMTGLAFARATQGLPVDALVTEAVDVARDDADAQTQVLALRTHAETLMMRDRHTEALVLLEEALLTARGLTNPSGRRSLLGRKADCCLALGDLPAAAATYRQAIRLADAAHEPRGYAWLLLLHVRILLKSQRPAAAIRAGQRARQLLLDVGDTRGAATASMHVGEAYLCSGRPREAITALEECLPVLRATSVRVRRLTAERLLTEARRRLGQPLPVAAAG